MTSFKTKGNLIKAMDIKWEELQKKYPEYNMKWIDGMHKLLDWYEMELKKIKHE